MTARRATVLRRGGLLGSAIALTLTMSASGIAQAALKDPSRAPAASRSVKAVLIYPWGGCAPASGWDELAAGWPMYGTTMLQIDSSTFCSTSTPVTYAALVADKASVLVFSDTAGGEYTLSPAEVAAITQYVQAGHNIVGTFLTFLYASHGDDNTALAPLFGLASSFAATVPSVLPDYSISRIRAPLFRAVPNPFDSGSYPGTQAPSGGHGWGQSALSGAKYVARTSGHRAAITIYKSQAYRYQAVYISSMPEFSPDTAGEQFLYNALTLAR